MRSNFIFEKKNLIERKNQYAVWAQMLLNFTIEEYSPIAEKENLKDFNH